MCKIPREITLKGGKQRTTDWHTCNKSSFMNTCPTSFSGANIAKVESGTDNTYAPTSHTAARTYSGYVLNIYSNTHRAGHGGRRATAGHGGPGGRICYCILCYEMQRAMSVAGTLPFPTVTGVWKRRRGVGCRMEDRKGIPTGEPPGNGLF